MLNSKKKHLPSDWEQHYEKDYTENGPRGKKRVWAVEMEAGQVIVGTGKFEQTVKAGKR